MIIVLQRIAGQCDGLRCDMAMLLLPEVFQRTWDIAMQPFWPKAIAAVRHAQPGLRVHGRGLLGPGMDAATTGLRPLLRQAAVRPAACASGRAGACAPAGRAGLPGPAGALSRKPRRTACGRHLCAAGACGGRGHHFLHAGAALLPAGPARGLPRAACRRTWCARRWSRWIACLAAFYARLLAVLRQPALRDGAWSLLDCDEAWAGNPSVQQFIAWRWQLPGAPELCVAVNYAPQPGQCYCADALARAGRPHAGACATCSAMRCTTGRATTCWRAACTWTCRPGATMCSKCRMPAMSEAAPPPFSQPAQLRNGTPVLIRAIRPDDRQRIIDAFHKLDPRPSTRASSAPRES